MKNLSRPLTNLAFILFILGIFASLYSIFFVMPEAMLQKMGISNTDHTKLDIAKEASITTLLLIGVELLIGLGLIIALLANNRKFVGTENIVYITNNTDNRQDKSQTEGSYDRNVALHQQAEEIKSTIEHESDTTTKLQLGINQLCQLLQATIGAVFVSKEINGRKYIEFLLGFAFHRPESSTLTYEYGEGIAGQAAKTGKELLISKVPDGYITVVSGLGKATPQYMVALPIFHNQVVVGVVEIASFTPFTPIQIQLAKEIIEVMGNYITIEVKGVVLGKN